MNFAHIVIFIKKYLELDKELEDISLYDVDGMVLHEMKKRVLIRTFTDELADKGVTFDLDDFIRNCNEVRHPDYDDIYEEEKRIVNSTNL